MGNWNELNESLIDLIGKTPVVRIRHLTGEDDAALYVKLESFNPNSNSKDRTAYGIIREAERCGQLKPGGTIFEITSGNTGIGLAAIGAALGYKVVIYMGSHYNKERFDLLRAFGAKVVPFDKDEVDVDQLKEKLIKLQQITPNSLFSNQAANPANPSIHRETTAKEILEQTGGKLDAFVATSGTGGTITGVGERLKEAIPGVTIHLVEPENSRVVEGGEHGDHRIYGISPPKRPEVLNTEILDGIIHISDEDAWQTARDMAQKEGLLVGPSSGAAVWGAIKVARELGKGKTVLALAPDTGERYLSIGLYDEAHYQDDESLAAAELSNLLLL
ncbi:cysteine synthase family protein [Paenibacillus filicis]|uniref:Cysteine synthase family protein n=1 Tax=Paenibacillus filicis TaxID=669464 RepID=A0ABU9DSD4_9BACL